MLAFDPTLAKFRTDIDEPIPIKSKTERADPIRPADRVLKEEPKFTKSRIDRALDDLT
jgi:hypothetical protein